MEVADFIRVRLRGTSDRVTLHEINRLKPEVEAALNAKQVRDTMQFAGKNWVRVFAADELDPGEHRILEFDECDVVVVRGPTAYHAFNNACPHLRLPLFEHRLGTGVESPRPARSVMTDDLGVICRWHESCFDLQTGEIRTWCHLLNEDGTPPGLEFLGDVSKNRTGLIIYGCRLHDGDLWISIN